MLNDQTSYIGIALGPNIDDKVKWGGQQAMGGDRGPTSCVNEKIVGADIGDDDVAETSIEAVK